MFIFLAALFIVKISKNAVFSVPRYVRAIYGTEKLKAIRRLVNLHRKLRKSAMDSEFIKLCILYNLTPKMARFKLHKDSLSKSRLANTFRNNILRTEINFHQRKMKTLRSRIELLEQDVYGSALGFTFFTKARIRAFIDKSIDNYIFSVNRVHKRKLHNLGFHCSDSSKNSAIFNDTDIIFSEKEIELLSKGLQYSYFPDKISLKHIQAEFENLFIQVAPLIKSHNHLIKFKMCLANGYSNFVSSFFYDRRTDRNFSNETHNLITSIKDKVEKYDLVVVKADKGNTVVILRRTEYVTKMLSILSDETKFKKVESEATLVRLRKFQSFLRCHHKHGVFTDEEYGELFPTSTNIPTMYGLPKTHKDGVPLRPILSMVGCFNHAFAKWIGGKLEHLREAKSIAKDSFSLNFLRGPSLTGCHFVSYDVVSLFTNIPLDQTIDLILEKLYPKTPGIRARDQRFVGMSRTVFKRSLDWCLRDNKFRFFKICVNS